MKKMRSEFLKKLLVVPPIILGVVIVAAMARNKKEPVRNDISEHARVLRVIPAASIDVVPRILGYGTAKPGKIWRAVAEVRGQVTEVHPRLKPGSIIKSGDTILRIDGIEYELAIAQLDADIEQAKAQLEEHDVKAINDNSSLKIEEKSLRLVEQAFERSRRLFEKNAVSEAQVDTDERNVLAQQQTVQSLVNSLNLVPTQKTALRATIAVKEASLAQAKLDLKKTVITAPFECRLGDVRIEKHQFLAAGELLFEAHSTDVTEVEAQILLVNARHLIHPDNRQKLPTQIDEKAIREMFDIGAIVRLHSGDFTVEWEAKFTRIREQIDPETQTLGFVVEVDKPYEKAIPGERPPLLKGTFCEVELRGKTLAKRIIIPRTALHEGLVYVVNSDNRLERRPVTVAFSQSNFVCLKTGLKPGERVVVSDPAPAIENMLVDSVIDQAVQESLIAEATGVRDLR